METAKKNIALIQGESDFINDFIDKIRDQFNIYLFDNGIKFFDWVRNGGSVDAVVSAGLVNSSSGLPLMRELRKDPGYTYTPFIFILDRVDGNLRRRMIQERVSDLFQTDFEVSDFLLRVNWLIENPVYQEEEEEQIQEPFRYHMPLFKRVFDIMAALLALTLLAPLFLLVIILIKLESKGPVFYIAKRVGTGYQIFNFYKFRSMKVGADAQLKNISHLNQYKNARAKSGVKSFNTVVSKLQDVTIQEVGSGKTDKENGDELNLSEYLKNQFDKLPVPGNSEYGLCEDCSCKGDCCQSVLYLEGEVLCEKVYLDQKKEKDEGKFIKINNDPRVTRIGKFIRNTSIDELPQLFNVLKGDMSIVGNRPLPLYEAEKITVDAFNLRFMAPSGITGLWQISKRGSSEMSEEERMQLDNEYAKTYSFWGDIKIILKTIPALLQKENV